MVLLVSVLFSAAEQGYYYTFASLLGLQIFFELGMNQVILQLVSHDFAHIEVKAGNQLHGDGERINRLSSLVKLVHRWYLAAALAFFLVVSVCGIIFFTSQGELPAEQWIGPWVLLTISTAANLYFSAKLTVLEGCGELASVARTRLIQSMIGSVALWGALSLGAGLWAIPLAPLVAVGYTTVWLRRNRHPVLRSDETIRDQSESVTWRRDVFPFQWRIALSWVSGYFIFQLFTPLVFAKHGSVEAGRLGITLAIFNALLSVGMSWVNAKTPAMAAQISRNERVQLNRLFNSVTRRSMLFMAGVAVLSIFALTILGAIWPAAAARFVSVPVAVCIAAVTVANTFIFAAAAYMRAHKEEPMLWVSVITGVATAIAVVFGVEVNVLTMMSAYSLIVLAVALPWTLILFLRYYRRVA